jgi:hypothetical protein
MTLDPEQQRIRSYLQGQAADKNLEDLIARVQEGVDELHAAANSVPAASLSTNPPGDDWAPIDCIRHAVQSDCQVAQQILHVALTGARPTDPEPTLDPERSALLARHTEAIDSLYAHVREADPAAFLDVKWDHPFFGDLNWREWLLFLRIHSKDHARQLVAMTAALGG